MGEKEGYIEIPGKTGILVPRIQYEKIVSFCLIEVGCCSPDKKIEQVEAKKVLFDEFFRKQETGEVFQVYTGIAHYSPFEETVETNGLDFVLHYTRLNKKMFDRFSRGQVRKLCQLVKPKHKKTVQTYFREKNFRDLYLLLQSELEINYNSEFRGTLGEKVVVNDIIKNTPKDMKCYPGAGVDLRIDIHDPAVTEIDVVLAFYHDGKFQNFIRQLGQMKNIDLRLNGKLRE